MNNDRVNIAGVIRKFLRGAVAPNEWDDFISVHSKDSTMEDIRLVCANIPKEFPTLDRRHYCSKAGFEKLERLARSLEETK
jgi:hypothetical protein